MPRVIVVRVNSIRRSLKTRLVTVRRRNDLFHDLQYVRVSNVNLMTEQRRSGNVLRTVILVREIRPTGRP